MSESGNKSTRADSGGARGSDARRDSWPGKRRAVGERCPDSEKHWNPTGFGPGMSLEIASGVKPDPESPAPEDKDEPVWESRTLADAADKIVRYRVGDECPNCGFAKLSLDANNHVSCPICGFGAYRACG